MDVYVMYVYEYICDTPNFFVKSTLVLLSIGFV